MKVSTSTGTWTVRRRWAPRQLGVDSPWSRFWERTRRVRKRTSDAADVGDPIPDGCGFDIGEAIVFFLVVIVVVLFLVFVGIPFLIALGELLVLVVLALGGVVARVVFRRPWTVDAIAPDGTRGEWQVVGWRASGRARAFIADRIRAAGAVPSVAEVTALSR